MRLKKFAGFFVIALFLASMAGVASAETLDLPKWVIVPEDSINFTDVTLFCGLDTMDTTNNVTPCYYQGSIVNATIYFNSTTGYPKLVSGKILNAFEFDNNANEYVRLSGLALSPQNSISVAFAVYVPAAPSSNRPILVTSSSIGPVNVVAWVTTSGELRAQTNVNNTGTAQTFYVDSGTSIVGEWHYVAINMIWDSSSTTLEILIDKQKVAEATSSLPPFETSLDVVDIGRAGDVYALAKILDEVRIRLDNPFTEDEIKALYEIGRMKLSELANFRQIFSPMVDLTKEKATFYAGLEVSTTDPNGYVPVPDVATNLSITSAEKLKSDYTGYDFYYQGHYWYRADKIQFNLPIQFETVRSSGGFDKIIILDEDKKTYVYEKEFKVTNPTATKINVIYSIDPVDLGFSVLQYPEFELDGIRMVSWQPQNSTDLKLIRTDTLEPGEISTHWIKSIWTLSKEELEFPAKLEDFRNILDWQTAQKLAENAAKGKGDTYVKVIKISSNADVSNVTIYVPLKGVEDESDVVEAVALTGSRETLQVEELDDGTIAVKVPADAFVSGEAEIKVFYNKETSWWKSILDRIKSMVQWIKSIFGFGGG